MPLWLCVDDADILIGNDEDYHTERVAIRKFIENTERYKHCVDFGNERYISAVAKTVEDIRRFAEDGWTYFQEIDGVKVFRKPM